MTTEFLEALKRESALSAPGKGGPAMDHEPTRKFIMGEYPEQQTAEYQRLNFGPYLP